MNKMKWTVTLLAGLMIIAALSGCGTGSSGSSSAAAVPVSSAAPASSVAAQSSETPAASSEVPSSSQAEAAESGGRKTSKESPNFTSGELPKITGPVLVTSAGRSADADSMGVVLKKAGVEYTLNPTASASEIAAAKTVIVVVGVSTKGLGAAGVSVEEELARSKAALASIPEGTTVICAHIGGDARRGESSDPFIELVMPLSDALFAVETGNADGLLTKLADESKIPYSLSFSLQTSVDIAKGMM